MSKTLKLEFFGAAGTVTGSKIVIQYEDQRFLFDCGLFQGAKEIRNRNWELDESLRGVKAAILSHAHIDHSGYLPKLVRDGFKGPIYCTPPTAELGRLLLLDAAHMQEEDAHFANSSHYSNHKPALPLFDQQDAEKAIELLLPVPFHNWHDLMPGLQFRFFRAGHILGSAITQIAFQVNGTRKILTLSGDLGNGRSQVLADPEKVNETDYLILESTYGDRQQPRVNPSLELERIITKVLGRGGTLIIPAFAVGRTQEILYLVQELERKGSLPQYPVYLDSPMANSATDIYLKFSEELKKDFHRDHGETRSSSQSHSRLSTALFKEVKTREDSLALCQNSKAKIVISAAGMLTGGRVLHHLKSKLPDSKSGVLFVGYQASGTKGLLLKNGLRNIRIHHESVDVNAEIFAIESLSAHADAEDLCQFVQNFKSPPEKIILNHGEKNALESLQYLLSHKTQSRVEIAKEKTTYTLS